MKHSSAHILLFAFLIISCVHASGPDQIIELFRHGARAPYGSYDKTWPNPMQLTAVGLRQHYVLGNLLANKYPDLFGSTYDYSKVYMISSPSTRCIQSAGAHLDGIYLGKGPAMKSGYPRSLAVPPYQDPHTQDIANSLNDAEALPFNFVPGVINVVDQSNVYIFRGDLGIYCPNMDKWYNQNVNDDATADAVKVFQPLFDELNKLFPTNLKIKNPMDFLAFSDALHADIVDNRPLPGGLTDHNLIEECIWAFAWFYHHFGRAQKDQRELAAYNTVAAMLDQLVNFRQGTTSNKVALFSGHDNNVGAVLAAFGLVTDECLMNNYKSVAAGGPVIDPVCTYPEFTANIIIEFYNSTASPYVKVLVNNMPAKICGGKYDCPYDEFVAFAKNSVGNNNRESYLNLCGVKIDPNAQPAPRVQTNVTDSPVITTTVTTTVQQVVVKEKSNNLVIQIASNSALGVLILLLTIKLFWDRRKHTRELKLVKEKNFFYEQKLSDKSLVNIP